jgi:hypothetical protein
VSHNRYEVDPTDDLAVSGSSGSYARTAYQVVVYEDVGGMPRVGQSAVVVTREVELARFLAVQLLMWHWVRNSCAGEDCCGYSAELCVGYCAGPLDAGLWVPARPDDPVADIAYLDADTGSVEWQVNAPTYLVVTEQQQGRGGRRG